MKKILVICIIILFIILAIITYLHISRKLDEENQIDAAVNQVQTMEQDENIQEKNLDESEETFLALIESIEFDNLKIRINEIKNGNVIKNNSYEILITDEIALLRNGENILLSDFQVNDKVSIVFDGVILTKNPPSLSRVKSITLLEDEG